MQFEEHEIIAIIPTTQDIFTLHVRPKDKKRKINFQPGQFYHIKNPTHEKPHETRQFSVITTPKTKTHLEFTIKSYGTWTKSLFKKNIGETISLFGPMGRFTHEKTITNSIFLAGGVGIAPILSILTSLHEQQSQTAVNLIYATHSEQTIIKQSLIEELFQKNNSWKKSLIVSNPDENWAGDRGHITQKFLTQKIDVTTKAHYFVCGSQRFTKNIIELLLQNNIPNESIKQEIFLPPYPKKSIK